MNALSATLAPNGAPPPSIYSGRVFVPFERGKNWLREADLLLLRAPGVVAWTGRGVHWHAATLSRWGADWFALETRPGGGRAIALSALVERYPTRIDVFRPNPDGRWPEYRPELAVAFARRAVALQYGWASVFRAAAARIPFLRYWLADGYFDDDARRPLPRAVAFDAAPDENDAENDADVRDLFRAVFEPRFERESLDDLAKTWLRRRPRTTLQCAEARALADRYAGVDPVPFLNDRFVEPADLARSSFYRYQFSFDSLDARRSASSRDRLKDRR